MLGNAATSLSAIKNGIHKHGPSVGGKEMLLLENEGASESLRTGVYAVWRSSRNNEDFCARIGPRSRCFCGHVYSKHKLLGKSGVLPTCTLCVCSCFNYVPQRPEEVGDWWLPRRRGFNVHSWKAKCKCGHAHDDHDPLHRSCKTCGCAHFQSNFLCVSCDGHWEEHETVFEGEDERKLAGLAIGHAFRPLVDQPDIHAAVFGGGAPTPEELYSGGLIDAQQYQDMIVNDLGPLACPRGGHRSSSDRQMVARVPKRSLNPPHRKKPERSVRLMHVSSGGSNTAPIVNRWGKTTDAQKK